MQKKIIEGVQANHTYTFAIWQALCAISSNQPRLLELSTDTWEGYSNGETIRVGTLPMPHAIRALLFGGENMTHDQEREYVLGHEVAHRLLKQRERYGLGELGGAVMQMRAATGRGLSALGSIDYYRSEAGLSQATEDIAELINMYLINPAYLRAYLTFLQDSTSASTRAELGLVTIKDAETANHIFSTIDNEVQEVLAQPSAASS